MPEQGRAKFRDLTFESGAAILTGPRTTRAGVAADFPNAKVGTLYISIGAGANLYVKIAHNTAAGVGQATDWEVVSTTAADSGT